VNVLIHICCAHCFGKTLDGLRAEFGYQLAARGLWYNPNIHPLLEYRRRMKALKVYLERDPVPVDFVEKYGLIPFCENTYGHYQKPDRCARCYAIRLDTTAERAAALGMDAFTTTMITSVHQSHQMIRAAGEEAGRRHKISFLYRNLRHVEPDEKKLREIYRQSYCGCVFSEYDRYASTTKHLYRGEGELESEGDDVFTPAD